ncbi:MAG TPA: sulfite oxidase-like oxidoreductase [Gammaproteobacteria bacterium]
MSEISKWLGQRFGGEHLPPGQHRVNRLPVLDLGIHPVVALADWRLTIHGLVNNSLVLSWEELRALPQVEITADIHCVTRWSCLDVHWSGVAVKQLLESVEPQPEGRFVTLHSYDNYTTNLPLAALLDDDVLLAHSLNGEPLSVEHGGPVRLVVPKRYFWKSAKWLKAIEIHAEDRPGFWEVRGYHNEAFPWEEQRFG